MADVEMTEGDRLPSLFYALHDYNGAMDLTAASGVKWVMMGQNGVNKVDTAATIVTAATGQVRYDWAALDVDTPGVFLGKWEVTVGGKTQKVPSDRYLVVEIMESPR